MTTTDNTIDPNETRDRSFDWAPQLATGETIASHTVTIVDRAGVAATNATVGATSLVGAVVTGVVVVVVGVVGVVVVGVVVVVVVGVVVVVVVVVGVVVVVVDAGDRRTRPVIAAIVTEVAELESGIR